MAKSKAGDDNNTPGGDTTTPDATTTAAVASYGGETARSGVQRSEIYLEVLPFHIITNGCCLPKQSKEINATG